MKNTQTAPCEEQNISSQTEKFNEESGLLPSQLVPPSISERKQRKRMFTDVEGPTEKNSPPKRVRSNFEPPRNKEKVETIERIDETRGKKKKETTGEKKEEKRKRETRDSERRNYDEESRNAFGRVIQNDDYQWTFVRYMERTKNNIYDVVVVPYPSGITRKYFQDDCISFKGDEKRRYTVVYMHEFATIPMWSEDDCNFDREGSFRSFEDMMKWIEKFHILAVCPFFEGEHTKQTFRYEFCPFDRVRISLDEIDEKTPTKKRFINECRNFIKNY